jgi:hypothetical protein
MRTTFSKDSEGAFFHGSTNEDSSKTQLFSLKNVTSAKGISQGEKHGFFHAFFPPPNDLTFSPPMPCREFCFRPGLSAG